VQETKKMSLMQLTFMVAVNMMGSGIIMLPSNMAKVGAISLLSWIVTAAGSMAIAYGFAQAGLFNQRPGGMAAYAEEAYGKPGYFNVFFLYFLSLAIGNVAIAASAVGYLAGFFPWLSSTPTATCIGVIALLWLTTVANFGGPSVTGRIGSITVWGVILPVGLLSVIGWFWFKGTTFGQAWNPQGMSLMQGMGSSIALTLWAFLGMESAAQNSDAVENPKKNVPLACMFGTLGAAVVYVLSTSVIQGIVPNADLVKSTGPFATAYAHMFNATVGSIVMGLAVLACLGSLLGWQFTIAQTGKSAADERMFPAFFSKVNSMGAPVTGMIVLAFVQSAMALSTISPNLAEQFNMLVNLAVVTNVVPYIVALSALMVMMKSAKVPEKTYRRNVVVALVAMLYSIFALYASGHDAVMGGMIVMGLTYVIWGFIAHRFTADGATERVPEKEEIRTLEKMYAGTVARTAVVRAGATAVAIVALATLSIAAPAPAPAPASVSVSAPGTLDRIRTAGRLKVGYRTDAAPLSFRDESGNPTGYSVDLCREIVTAVKLASGVPGFSTEWVPVSAENRFRALQTGEVDLLCGADTVTLARREEVSFSIPVFPGGIGAVLRKDAPARLKEVLGGEKPAYQPMWRASAGALLQAQVFSVVTNTTAATWVSSKLNEFKLTAEVVPVDRYEAGIQRLLERRSNVLFGDRAILMEAAARGRAAEKLFVIDRQFTYEPLALAFARNDENFRLLVDRTLSRLYASGQIGDVYAKWFGEPDEKALSFFRINTVPD
jgi:putrescine:ornithine antiporter